jgi:hypothetical protein
MKRTLLILILACLLINCKQRNSTAYNKSARDSVNVIKRAKIEDSTLIHSREVTYWINNNFKSSGNKRFTLKDFSSNDSLPVEVFVADSVFLDNYRSVLRWSPDSAYILDVGSYGSVLVRDATGNYRLEAGEPDTEVALLDLQNKARKRLLMAGPSSTIVDGKWINNDVLLITGTFNKNGSGDRDTLLWLINVKENFLSLYKVETK